MPTNGNKRMKFVSVLLDFHSLLYEKSRKHFVLKKVTLVEQN